MIHTLYHNKQTHNFPLSNHSEQCFFDTVVVYSLLFFYTNFQRWHNPFSVWLHITILLYSAFPKCKKKRRKTARRTKINMSTLNIIGFILLTSIEHTIIIHSSIFLLFLIIEWCDSRFMLFCHFLVCVTIFTYKLKWNGRWIPIVVFIEIGGAKINIIEKSSSNNNKKRIKYNALSHF